MRRAAKGEPPPPQQVEHLIRPHAVTSSPLTSASTTSLFPFLSLFLPFLLLRCATAVLLRTYFNPDEPWQSLEVAYSVVWPPYGHRTWEWTPTARIRGWAHVLPFIAFYRAIRAFEVDTAFMVAYGPRLLQAVLVAVADAHFYRLAVQLIGEQAARWAVSCAHLPHPPPWYGHPSLH